MIFLTPRYVKQGRQFVKDARKLVAYKRDVAPPDAVAGVESEIARLETVVKGRDAAAVEAQMQRLDQACGTLTQPLPDAGWRENVEVFLVAIVIALAVRTYFLQPFTIPTGSMEPTLNGIIGTVRTESMPNPVSRMVQFAAFGRTYVEVFARADERIENVDDQETRPGLLRFLTWTRIDTSAGNTYWVWAGRDTVRKMLEAAGSKYEFKAGEPILRGYVTTGDHVFVDKITYNFRPPTRGEVFVFSTHGILPIQRTAQVTQYYIKRLGGVPHDTLRIEPPRLFVNGEVAQGVGFQRVMSGQHDLPNHGYRGYGNIPSMSFLTSPQDTFNVPAASYFALGDNSYNSSDSRAWGLVPEENVMGRAVLVYWPFASHWSLIR